MEEKISPKMLLSHMVTKYGVSFEELKVGPLVIGSWNHDFINKLAEEVGAEPIQYWPHKNKGYNWYINGKCVTFIELPVGAPAAVSTTESLIACGARAIIGIGLTGSLQPDIRIGDIVLPDSCLREEGTSYHYIKDDSEIVPGSKLSKLLIEVLNKENIKFNKGRIWTIDAIFRELNTKVEEYSKQGILSVEMETSAMYAVGKFRGMEISNILVVSDELFGEWNPHFVGSSHIVDSLNIIKNVFVKNIDWILLQLELL